MGAGCDKVGLMAPLGISPSRSMIKGSEEIVVAAARRREGIEGAGGRSGAVCTL